MGKQSEIKVKVTGVHLCCQGCVDAVDAAVKNVAGVTSRCDMEKRAVALTARNDAAAQRLSTPLPPLASTARPTASNWR